VTAPVLVSEHGPVRTLTLNRPERRNAIDFELYRALHAALLDMGEPTETRAVVLTGAGPAFSAGGDLESIRQMQDDVEARRSMLELGRVLFETFVSLRLPVIAAVNGPAVGAGCTLALLCDVVVMAEDAYLADPHVSVGLVPGDGGAVLWPLLAGLGPAKAYLLTGDRIGAQEAQRLGLVHQVVPGSPVEAATGLATRIADRPAFAVQETKVALNLHLRARDDVLRVAIEAEERSFDDGEHRQVTR
jgi:enoyl-CoA hydratase